MQGLHLLEADTKKVVTLASEAPSNKQGTQLRPIHYANDLVVASDGSVYFTDSCDIPPAINPAGFYDTMASFLLAAFQVGVSVHRTCCHKEVIHSIHLELLL